MENVIWTRTSPARRPGLGASPRYRCSTGPCHSRWEQHIFGGRERDRAAHWSASRRVDIDIARSSTSFDPCDDRPRVDHEAWGIGRQGPRVKGRYIPKRREFRAPGLVCNVGKQIGSSSGEHPFGHRNLPSEIIPHGTNKTPSWWRTPDYLGLRVFQTCRNLIRFFVRIAN